MPAAADGGSSAVRRGVEVVQPKAWHGSPRRTRAGSQQQGRALSESAPSSKGHPPQPCRRSSPRGFPAGCGRPRRELALAMRKPACAPRRLRERGAGAAKPRGSAASEACRRRIAQHDAQMLLACAASRAAPGRKAVGGSGLQKDHAGGRRRMRAFVLRSAGGLPRSRRVVPHRAPRVTATRPVITRGKTAWAAA